MSRVSTGSSGSSQDIRGESAFTHVSSPGLNIQPNNTSTPAKYQSPYGRQHAQDEANSSVISRIPRPDDMRSPPGYDQVTSPHYSDSHDGYSPHYQSNREPIPYRDRPSPDRDHPSPHRDRPSPDRDRPSPDRDRLTADARLDMLTRGNQPASPSNWSPSHSVSSPNQRPVSDGDMSVRSAQSRTGSSTPSGWQAGSTPSPGQRPIKATIPAYARSHSPGRQLPQAPDRDPRSPPPPPQRKGNILVSRAGPRPFEKKNMSNISRTRPASAFGAPVSSYKMDHSVNSPLNNSVNSDMNNSSNLHNTFDDSSFNNSPNTSHHNGPVQMRNNTRAQPSSAPRYERPKSVPPTMFNAQGGSDSESGYINNEFPPNNVTPPVPPPRKNRDILPGRYTILREPGPSPQNKSLPATLNNSMSPSQGPLNNSISNAMNVSQSSRGPPAGNRIGPPPKAPYNKQPPPRPMKPDEAEENRDPKQNSIWYEYGCV